MRLTFDKHNREHSQFLFQCGNFSSTRGGGWVGLSETRVVGRGGGGEEFSLSCSSSIRSVFSDLEPILIALQVKGEGGVSLPGRKIASMLGSGSSQWKSLTSRSDTRYPLVSLLCAPTLENTYSRISFVFCWLGVIGTLTRWLFK